MNVTRCFVLTVNRIGTWVTCAMRPLKDVLPDASDKVLYVFYDFETTQNTKYSDKATLHVPDLVCVQQFW